MNTHREGGPEEASLSMPGLYGEKFPMVWGEKGGVMGPRGEAWGEL